MEPEMMVKIAMQIALVFVMFTMGLQLGAADFRRVLRIPRSVALGAFGQLVVLPLLALAIIQAAELPAYTALGLFLVAVCPGGPLSNFFAHIGGGDAALSVTLTAVTTAIGLVTLPLVFHLATDWGIALPTAAPVAFIVKALLFGLVVPIAIGMVVRVVAPRFSRAVAEPFNKVGMLLIVIVLLLIMYRYREMYANIHTTMLASVIGLNLLAMIAGWLLPRLAGAPVGHPETLAYEVGIQNIPLASLIGYGLTAEGHDLSAVAVVLGVIGLYAIISVINAWGAVWLFRRLSRAPDPILQSSAGVSEQ